MAPGRAVAAVLALAALAGGACSSDGDGGTNEQPTPVSSDKTVPTPTTAIDVSTIPAKIDEPYINAVLAALDQVDGEATRIIVQNRRLIPAAADHMRSIYDEREFQERIEVWLTILNKGLQNIRDRPGNRRRLVTRMVAASPSCVFAQVEEDLSQTAIVASPPHKSFVKLLPLERARDHRRLNPTAWMIGSAGETSDGSDPGNLCAT